jgi:hypothetical protein
VRCVTTVGWGERCEAIELLAHRSTTVIIKLACVLCSDHMGTPVAMRESGSEKKMPELGFPFKRQPKARDRCWESLTPLLLLYSQTAPGELSQDTLQSSQVYKPRNLALPVATPTSFGLPPPMSLHASSFRPGANACVITTTYFTSKQTPSLLYLVFRQPSIHMRQARQVCSSRHGVE